MAIISKPWKRFSDAEGFKATYLRMLPLLHFNYSAINPVAVKSLMHALGMPVGKLRKPLRNLEGEALMQGVRIVRRLGLDKKYGYTIHPKLANAA
jgi:4-hydroxy-tetrahydrodipicolinate synthase